MPRESKERVSNLPTQEPVSKPQDLRVVARPVDQTVMPAAQDSALTELVAGLSSINPQLQQYVQQKNTTDAHAAYETGQTQAQRDTIGMVDPMQALNAPEALPSNIEPAFNKQFHKGYREVIGLKTAEKLQADLMDAWAKERMKADTNVEQFLKEWVGKNTAGFDDPIMLGPITQRLTETYKAIRSDARAIDMALFERSTREGIAATFSQITPDMPVDQMMSTYYSKVLPVVKQTNFVTSTEAAGMLLDRVNAISTAMGGAPELFDAMKEFKDPSTGKTLAEMNPGLAEKIEVQRKAADETSRVRMEKVMQPVHFHRHMTWEKRADEGNPPTMDEIVSQMGSMGMYKSYGEAVNAYLHFHKKADDARQAQQALAEIRAGNGAALPEKDQKKYMDMVTDPMVATLFNASNQSNDPNAFNMAAAQLIQAHKGMSVPNTRLQNLFGTIRQAMPGKDEAPSPRFKMLANLYAQLPPNLQSAYVTDEDSRLILSRYNEARSGGPGTQQDEKTALAQAYASVSKEAKEAGRQFASTPEGREQIRSTLSNTFAVMGWRKFLPFVNAANEDEMVRIITHETRGYIERMGGSVTTDEALTWAKQRLAERFVYDKTAGRYVEVPPTSAGESTAEAISAYTEKMAKQFPGRDVYMVHMGNGKYQVRDSAGASGAALAYPTIQEIKDDHYALKNLDPRTNEGGRLVVLTEALKKGTLTPEQLNQEANLIAKARALGLWDSEMGKKVDEVRKRAFETSFAPILRDVPPASTLGADQSRLPPDGTTNKTDIAKMFFEANHDGKAMTVLAEGITLKRHPDNKGFVIGIGYNMQANARTLNEDFRRAGIPADAVDGVREGKLAITRDQALRLFEISYARAQDSARNSIERIFGKGQWEQLPSNRKAVLTDVAYQAGSIDQFKPTLDKFMAGIGDVSEQNPKVHYEVSPGGPMKADAPRNNMRLTVLNGGRAVKALIERASAVPRNKIEAQALLNPK